MATLKDYASKLPLGRPRRVMFRFLTSPVEIVGNERVEGIRVVRNRLEPDGKGGTRAVATDETEVLPVGLVFRSVGYKGVALPGLPFDDRAGTIPNAGGRVLTAPGASTTLPGVYVAGWIKRGPSGVIGTNKPCAVESAELLLADRASGALPAPTGDRAALDRLLAERGVRIVTYADWQTLDRLEIDNGKAAGRPRLKFTRIDEMLEALT
jgi:ferredoxin--NADP+ reductase